MEDITPKLLGAIQADFQDRFSKSEKIKSLYAKVRDGTATYEEANEFATETGRLLSLSFQKNLSEDILPDGKMYYNIANRILNSTLTNNHKLITDVTSEVQTSLNKAAGIGLKAVVPDVNRDRIKGIVNKVSTAEKFSEVAWLFGEPIVNFSQSIVDDAIRSNAEFQYKSGMKPKIIRKEAGNCCDWCKEVVGTYTYPDVPDNVYKRHRYCRCTVTYDPGEGKVQDVHTKKFSNRDDVNERIRNSRAYEERIGIETQRQKAERKLLAKKYQEEIALSKGTDVTEEYQRSRSPKKGTITYESGYDLNGHPEEVDMARWLHRNMGGNVRLLLESNIDGVKTPDYEWNEKLWDLKSTTTEKAANSAVRKGLKQIKEDPGGIILNYKKDVDLQETINVIEKRMRESKSGEAAVDVMIVVKGKLIKVVRY